MSESTTTEVKAELAILKWITVGFAVFSLFATIAFFTWWALKDQFVFGGKPFDKVEWMTAKSTPESRCFRGDMALDIQQSVLKRGMTRQETTILLGRPNWEDANTSEYDLGFCLWDTHGLVLFFDTTQHLSHARIAQH